LQRHGALMQDAPMAVPALLQAQLLADHGADLAVPSGHGSDALWAEARGTFAPLLTLVRGAPGELPLLQSRVAGEAYVCRRGSCGLPARSIEGLREALSAWSPLTTMSRPVG
jgi:uncharacterized protein YyaL (SSP411 family)